MLSCIPGQVSLWTSHSHPGVNTLLGQPSSPPDGHPHQTVARLLSAIHEAAIQAFHMRISLNCPNATKPELEEP